MDSGRPGHCPFIPFPFGEHYKYSTSTPSQQDWATSSPKLLLNHLQMSLIRNKSTLWSKGNTPWTCCQCPHDIPHKPCIMAICTDPNSGNMHDIEYILSIRWSLYCRISMMVQWNAFHCTFQLVRNFRAQCQSEYSLLEQIGSRVLLKAQQGAFFFFKAQQWPPLPI